MNKKPTIQMVLAVILVALGIQVQSSAAQGTRIKQIVIDSKAQSVQVMLSEKPVFKTVKIDTHEILIAFNNATLSSDFSVQGKKQPFIQTITAEQFSGKVVSVLIAAMKPVGTVTPVWNGTDTLTVSFAVNTVVRLKKQVKKNALNIRRPSQVNPDDAFEKKQIKAYKDVEPPAVVDNDLMPTAEGIDAEKIERQTATIAKRSFDQRFTGSTDDLLLELRSDACADIEELEQAVKLCHRKHWQKAWEIFESYINNNAISARCLENVYILRGYGFYKSIGNKEPDLLLQAVSYLQEFMSYFPDSIYMPYAIASLGKIYYELGDYIQAEGYFKVILRLYGDYPGTPEVLFELGRIYTETDKPEEAVEMLAQVVREFSHGSFITDARLALGNAYFKKNDFKNALDVLRGVAEENPRKIFESPGLLLNIGNSFYHVGNPVQARETLARAYNIFPGMDNKDTILTRIGDTFVDADQPERAVKVFRLVIEKFPNTDGFVISSMRLAEYLKTPEEKAGLYEVIIKDYPDNPLTRLAMIRLALLQNKSGDYEKSVETLKALLRKKPRALRREALNLLQESSGLVFKDMLESDAYTALLARFEDDKRFLTDADNPELFLLVGQAYLRAHLYEKAVDTLMKAYKRSAKDQRKPELLYALGVAMQEAGKDQEALDMLQSYTSKYPGHAFAADGFRRKGRVEYTLKAYPEAVTSYKNAFLKTDNKKIKAGILVEEALAWQKQNKHDDAVKKLRQAVRILAGGTEPHYEILYDANRLMGESLMTLQRYREAADSLAMAVSFAGKDDSLIEVRFMLAEAYEKSGDYQSAQTEYTIIVDNGDTFWSGMASERLKAMKLNLKLEKT